ncbi:MAG: tRNA (guanosine(37)-N1)-methyltransferase TrmD [Phycisphaerae bacterium]
MRIDILTLFPDLFDNFRGTSIVGRAINRGLVDLDVTNIRDFALDRYGTVDDNPYGGGPGMVLMCRPIFDAVEHVRSQAQPDGEVILLCPQGEPLTQDTVLELKQKQRLILVAGHYEGFDERIRTGLADREISLGDFVLSGGEIPAMALTDAIVRLLPGALGKDESTHEESFMMGLLEYPQYTRPREFRGMEVPDILLSGDHAKIADWRQKQAEQRTKRRRPDVWERYLQAQNPQEDQPPSK